MFYCRLFTRKWNLDGGNAYIYIPDTLQEVRNVILQFIYRFSACYGNLERRLKLTDESEFSAKIIRK